MSCVILWQTVRERAIVHWITQTFAGDEARRPSLYSGITPFNSKAMRKMLGTLPYYEATTLLKLWTSSIITSHKKSQISGEVLPCICGLDHPMVEHVLWSCPNSGPSPPTVSRLEITS